MISKKVSATKRAVLPRSSDCTEDFRKDWDRFNRAGRFDMAGLKKLMMMFIANDGPLPPEYKDHQLTGVWKDHRDCHVHGDFLLLYRLDGEGQHVVFARIGTHSELFK